MPAKCVTVSASLNPFYTYLPPITDIIKTLPTGLTKTKFAPCSIKTKFGGGAMCLIMTLDVLGVTTIRLALLVDGDFKADKSRDRDSEMRPLLTLIIYHRALVLTRSPTGVWDSRRLLYSYIVILRPAWASRVHIGILHPLLVVPITKFDQTHRCTTAYHCMKRVAAARTVIRVRLA